MKAAACMYSEPLLFWGVLLSSPPGPRSRQTALWGLSFWPPSCYYYCLHFLFTAVMLLCSSRLHFSLPPVHFLQKSWEVLLDPPFLWQSCSFDWELGQRFPTISRHVVGGRERFVMISRRMQHFSGDYQVVLIYWHGFAPVDSTVGARRVTKGLRWCRTAERVWGSWSLHLMRPQLQK